MIKRVLLAGGLWLVSTAVTCEVNRNVGGVRALGRIVVHSVTTGSNVDPDGYIVTLDPGTPPMEFAYRIADNDSVTFGADGTHVLLLSDMAANCTVSGNNPDTVTVNVRSIGLLQLPVTAYVTFRVACVAAEYDSKATLHPLILGSAPPFPWRPPRA